MKIPFGVYRTLDVKMDDGVDKCHDFIKMLWKLLMIVFMVLMTQNADHADDGSMDF